MGLFIWPPEGAGTPSAGDLCECYFDTLAEMAASQAPNSSPLMYNFEVYAPYEFVPGDVTPDDGWSSIASTAGFAGRWLLRATRVSIGTTAAEQGARLSSAIAALAGKAIVMLRGERFDISTPINLASNVVIEGDPATLIVSTMVPTPGAGIGGYLNSAFFAESVAAGAATTIAITTGSVGDRVIRTTAPLVAGQRVILDTTLCINESQQATVLSVAGGAGTPATLDQPLIITMPVGSPLQPRTFPTGIRIYGNGMQISGTGDRAIEIAAGYQCFVSGIRVTREHGNFTSPNLTFDTGSQDCHFDDVYVDGGEVSGAGITVEWAYGCTVNRAIVDFCNELAGGCAIGFYGGVANALTDYLIRDTSIGVLVTHISSGDIDGNNGLTMTGGVVQDAATAGVQIACNSRQTTIDGLLVERALDGVVIDGNVDGVPHQTRVFGATLRQCSGHAINHQRGTGTLFDGLHLEDNVSELSTQNLYRTELTIRNVTGSRTDPAAAFECVSSLTSGGGSDIVIDGFAMDVNPTAQEDTFGVSGINLCSLRLTLANVQWRATGADGIANAVFLQAYGGGGATFDVTISTRNLRTYGGKFGIYFNAGTSYTYFEGSEVDYSSVAVAPITFDATTIRNRRDVTMTLGVATFPWPRAAASDHTIVVNRIATAQGLVGAGGILVTPNPGVGWVLTSIDLAGATVVTDESTFACWAP